MNTRAIYLASGSGIFAICAEADFLVFDFDEHWREMDGCSELNQSPPCLVPSLGLLQ